MKTITIIIPAYNEEESLPFLYERLEKLMDDVKNYEFEILFVNDGSKDNTLNLIKEQLEDMKNGNFTDEEVENAKKSIISSIKTIDDEQDTGIMYCFGQEMSGNRKSIEEYIERIKKINKEDVLQVANKVEINTIYFLRN